MKNIAYREINTARHQRESSGRLQVVFHNVFFPFKPEHIQYSIEALNAAAVEFDLHLVDSTSQCADSGFLENILASFPKARIFIPQVDAKSGIYDGLLLFAQESKAEHLFFISGNVYLDRLEMKELVEQVNHWSDAGILVPHLEQDAEIPQALPRYILNLEQGRAYPGEKQFHNNRLAFYAPLFTLWLQKSKIENLPSFESLIESEWVQFCEWALMLYRSGLELKTTTAIRIKCPSDISELRNRENFVDSKMNYDLKWLIIKHLGPRLHRQWLWLRVLVWLLSFNLKKASKMIKSNAKHRQLEQESALSANDLLLKLKTAVE